MTQTIHTHLMLLTAQGRMCVPAQIRYEADENAKSPSEISLVYNNIQYQGNGTDFLWVDSFVDLQRKLPADTKLACCITCRHGNLCPYGNKENQLFCTKGIPLDKIIHLVYN